MTSEEFKTRLGPADELQLRLLLRLPPARRLQTMLEMQKIWLDSIRSRLRRLHPELSDLELTRLMFERLKRNG
jgi:hypothetical protein